MVLNIRLPKQEFLVDYGTISMKVAYPSYVYQGAVVSLAKKHSKLKPYSLLEIQQKPRPYTSVEVKQNSFLNWAGAK